MLHYHKIKTNLNCTESNANPPDMQRLIMLCKIQFDTMLTFN